MSTPTPYVIPASPPAEALAELDEAARVLDGLRVRAARLILGMDGDSRSLRVELEQDGDVRTLSASALLDVLAGDPH